MPDNNDFNVVDPRHAPCLQAFLATAPMLTREEQAVVFRAATQMLAGYYAHLPQKRVTQGFDPVARLKALARAFEVGAVEAPLGLPDFHEALCGVFAELRDFHTSYLLPAEFAGSIAFLPFQAALLQGEGGADPQVLVTQTVTGLTHHPFGPGATIVTWNGSPIARVLQRLAAHSGGANPAAAASRGVAFLTQRPMQRMPPPAEEWVDVGYRPAGADPAIPATNLRLIWRVAPVAVAAPQRAEPLHPIALHMAVDTEGEALLHHRQHVFSPRLLSADHAAQELDTDFAELRAWAGQTDGYSFGVLRIRKFSMDSGFLIEIRRILGLLPKTGLILDIRDNPGGYAAAAEQLLQFFTNVPVRPVQVQFLATPETLALCRRQSPDQDTMKLDLSAWVPSLEVAVAAGKEWSDGFPMTDFDDVPPQRVYCGPVVLITSARSYSAADIFTAGFRDNGLGKILGVDADTGAGGANMWTHQQLALLTGDPQTTLPQGIELRLAIRRVLRADGDQVLEEAGIVPDEVHRLTRRDLLEGDPDLIAHAVGMLKRG